MDPGTLNDVQAFAAISLILVTVGVAVTALRWIWVRTGRSQVADAPEFEELRARVAELEADRGHMAELEERLDFTERLLARQAEIDRLAGGA